MAEFSGEQAVSARTEHLPSWVIEHMIRLSEYAAFRGLSAFESKLVDATEVLLQELHDNGMTPAKGVAHDRLNGSNVIPFTIMANSENPDPNARCGTGCT